MPLSGKQWAVGEALKAEHRQDHNALPLVLAGSGISVTAYGAGTAETGATNTAAIQAALTAEPIVVVPAGTFNLATAGTNPYAATHKYCLDLPSNTSLVLAPGAVLQLADGQQTDAGGAVDIIVGQSISNTTIAGSGKILGNTAGQTGWSGGYSQITNGCIVRLYGGCSDITVEGVTLGDHWSNPFDISANAGRNSRIRLSDLYVYDVGEGLEIIATDECWIDRCVVADPSSVMVGDGVEFAGCTNFSSTDCKVTASASGGAALDIFGSTNGAATGLIVDGWTYGLSIDDNGTTDPESVVVEMTMTNVTNGATVGAATLAGVVLRLNMEGDGSGQGIQLAAGSKAIGPVLLDGCVARGFTNGLITKAVSDLTINGGVYSNNSGKGIWWQGMGNAASDADVKNLTVVGVSACGNGQEGIYFSDNGGGFQPTGTVSANTVLDNVISGIGDQGTATALLTMVGNAT